MPDVDRLLLRVVRLRVVRPEDLLVLDVEFTNMRLSDDGQRLERAEHGTPAVVTVYLPSQHVAESVFFEFEQSIDPADPPPIGALAAAPTRLAFTLPDGQASIAFSPDGLLDWSSLVPRLAPNALPPGTLDGPAPAVPEADQTAIEFPYRLLLSPDAKGRWNHRHAPFTAAGRTELWHTRLSADRLPAPVRAVGRRAVPDTLRTSLSDRDLDDIVTLTSDFSIRPKAFTELGLPFAIWLERLRAARLLGFHYLPLPLDAEELMLTALGASVRLRGRWDYPEPDQDTAVLQSFRMPTPSLEQYEHITGLGRDQCVRLVRRGFVHPGMRASIVKVTERRFEPRQLRTDQTPQGPVGVFGGTAYLRQYFKVVIQEPEIDYGALAGGYEFGGREMLLRSLRLTSLETPKIDLPGASSDTFELAARQLWITTHPPGFPIDELFIARQAQEALEATFTQPFWIKVSKADFEFGFVATDWEGQTFTGGMPLVFVPKAAQTPDAAGVTLGLSDEERWVLSVLDTFAQGDESRRTRPLGNQKLALADPTGSAPNSTCAPTETLTFALQNVPLERQVSLPVLYHPRWVMAVSGASVHLEAVARLIGNDTPIDMSFDLAYLKGGLAPGANPAGVFAKFQPIKVAFGGARGGGLARPDARVNRISSRQGVMADNFATTEINRGDLAAVFGDAKLFGILNLKDILADIGMVTPDHFGKADLSEPDLEALLADPTRRIEVPVLRTRPLVRDGRPYAVEARFVWKPLLDLSNVSKTLFAFEEGSELVLDARTVTPFDGTQPTSAVRGELRRFVMSFFGVVKVRMELLRFVARPGRKPDVTAEGLDVAFEGPLQFVNTLRNILPANGFSDPPAIQVTPEGISAGFSLGVPSVGVGIFSLQNIALSAALSVPFVGKPAGVRFAISERHHPFLVTVTLFGGGGFFALGVSANGVDEIEAAIEFGGNVSLNLGVASGGVYIMAGVYFGLTGEVATLTGYLRCGGYLSVLGLISISIEFYLAFTYLHKGGERSEVWGQASLAVCVKVACFSKSVSLSIERRFAGGGGDPTLEQVIEPADWRAYCLAFAADEPA